jgi:MSHA biogenesis protein MshI
MLQVEAPSLPPDAPADERRQAIRWRVKEMVDFSIEQAGVDVLDIPVVQGGGGRAPQVFAVVANHSALVPRIHAFQDAKVPLEAIDIPELAQRNIAALFEEENRGLALLTFDDEGGRLTFTYRGELYAMRHIEVGRKELAAAGGEAPGGVFERVLLDVQRSLDNFDRNYSFITLTRLLVAPLPGAAAFVEYLKGNLYQPVELLDLAQGLDCERVPALADPERQAEALMAIGAALRDEGRAPA